MPELSPLTLSVLVGLVVASAVWVALAVVENLRAARRRARPDAPPPGKSE